LANLYLTDALLTQAQLQVSYVRQAGNGVVAFAVGDVIGRPAGGGQPADHCRFLHRGIAFDVVRASKQSEAPHLTLYEYAPFDHVPVEVGETIEFFVDKERRLNLSRCHTLTHLLMGAIRRCVPDYESRGAEIGEDEVSCALWFASVKTPSKEQIAEIDQLGRSAIGSDFKVSVTVEKSLELAAQKYASWRVDQTLGLKGKVRTIVIGDAWDANPCSGTHAASTGEIGAYAIGEVEWSAQRGCWQLNVERAQNWRYWYND